MLSMPRGGCFWDQRHKDSRYQINGRRELVSWSWREVVSSDPMRSTLQTARWKVRCVGGGEAKMVNDTYGI